jgi:N-acetyl-gamma-glutamyl-phosphate reductase
MLNIFVDGSHGTAGLLLMQQLVKLQEKIAFNIVSLDTAVYKDEQVRYNAIVQADIAILCLPEDIAKKTMQDLKSIDTVVIDVSPAHRTDIDWVYGFSELEGYENRIKGSNRISNPGCFATGMISLLNPLVPFLNTNIPVSIYGVTGYSAGGKKAIEKQKQNPIGFRATNLNKVHRHIPEVKYVTQIKNHIAFMPSVGNFARGQIVQIAFFKEHFNNISLSDIYNIFYEYYKDFDSIEVSNIAPSYLNPETMTDNNNVKLYIIEAEDKESIQLISMYDNLGKGAAGAVIQNLKLLLN